MQSRRCLGVNTSFHTGLLAYRPALTSLSFTNDREMGKSRTFLHWILKVKMVLCWSWRDYRIQPRSFLAVVLRGRPGRDLRVGFPVYACLLSILLAVPWVSWYLLAIAIFRRPCFCKARIPWWTEVCRWRTKVSTSILQNFSKIFASRRKIFPKNWQWSVLK